MSGRQTMLAAAAAAVSLFAASHVWSASRAPRVAAPSVGAHVDGDHFSVDASLTGACAAGSECALAIRVAATGDFHINPDYPHKFTATDTPGVEFLGKDPAKKNVFSKPAGDFTLTDAKSGVLTVRFKAQAGAPTVAGTLKLGVCSDETCMLPEVDLAVPVTVK